MMKPLTTSSGWEKAAANARRCNKLRKAACCSRVAPTWQAVRTHHDRSLLIAADRNAVQLALTHALPRTTSVKAKQRNNQVNLPPRSEAELVTLAASTADAQQLATSAAASLSTQLVKGSTPLCSRQSIWPGQLSARAQMR